MKRLINSSMILSLALYVVPPFAAQAESVNADTGGPVQCVPTKKNQNCAATGEQPTAKPAPAENSNDKAASEKAAADKAAAEKAAAEKAAADKAAAQQAAEQKKANQAAAAQAKADKAAKQQAAQEKEAAKKAAADQAAADADAKTAKQQAAQEKEAAKKAAADQAAADKAVSAKAADKAAADKVAADKAAAEQVAADKAARKAATDKTATEKTAVDQADADKALADKLAADKAATDKAATDKAQADANGAATQGMKVEHPRVVANGQQVVCLPNKATACPTGEVCVVAKNMNACQTQADKKMSGKPQQGNQTEQTQTQGTVTQEQAAADEAAAQKSPADKAAADKAAADQAAMDQANIAAARKAQRQAERAAAKAAAADPSKVVEAPVVDKQAQQSLETALDAPAGATADPQVVANAAALAAKNADKKVKPSDQPTPKDVKVTKEKVTKEDTRKSDQDFQPAPVQVSPGKKSGLSDLEKVGLVALGALAIGAIINGNKQVVSNTGDRVVVRQDDGSYQVYKDDSSLMRQPGSDVVTQTYPDGSTRTIFTRPDTSQIVTVRDASGRVLQRIAYDRNGNATTLIDDLRPERPVDVTRLPQVRPQYNTIPVDTSDTGLQAALDAQNAVSYGDQDQTFSLRQIRTIPQVRYLAPTIDVPNVTFDTGSSAIQPTEAQKLNKLGQFISDLVAKSPGEVFLIEGYTDAVGSAASNLALSDRRAESVAKVLTEYFQVPPENLVVQGYGESDLLVQSGGDEPANRRVAVRIITPLLQQQVAAN